MERARHAWFLRARTPLPRHADNREVLRAADKARPPSRDSLCLRNCAGRIIAIPGDFNLCPVHVDNRYATLAPNDSRSHLLIETKVKGDVVNLNQLSAHLKLLDDKSGAECRLLLLTPDVVAPKDVAELDDERLVWASFSALDEAIDELLVDKDEVVSEREAFLLRELQAMLDEEDLVSPEKNVVVVAAKRAWKRYLDLHAYICQPRRSFRSVTRMAFYRSNAICPLVPKICKMYHAVRLQRNVHDEPLKTVVEEFLKDQSWREGDEQMVMILTAPKDQGTLDLRNPITNDLASDTGRRIPFTQSQRYVSEVRLTTAKRTSDLIDSSHPQSA